MLQCIFLHCLSIRKLFVVFLDCLSICKLSVVFLHCLEHAHRISLTKALVLWWCDNKSDLIWFDLIWVDGKSLGKHDLVIRFLRGARRLNPPRPHLVPSWDLPSVLSALRGAPFEPLQSVELKFLSLKTVLLSALATVKRVGDLQAFSVDDSCLEFGPADSHVVLRPRPGYVPRVPTMPFRDQVVNLQALPREEADPAIALLCPVRALHIYVDRTQSFRTSDQLFVCFGGQQKGRAVSKQRLAHWIVEAIVLAYQARRLPCPLGVRAHSTRGVASSWALARGASIADICKAAGWATPNTFARFYNLRIEPVSSRVLVSDGQ